MKEKDLHAHHISQQFNAELDEVKTRMLEMGGLVEKQVADATTAFMNQDSGLADEVSKGDRLVNALEVSIDEECTIILARRQPAASDLRLVLSISKILSDLERMGDEAKKVAESSIKLSELGGLPRSVLEIRHIGDHVAGMVHSALDAFARFDSELALQVAEEDNAVDLEYGTAMRSLVTYMMEDPRTISSVLQVMWALRSLERIGDHARNIAEHVIYLVKGENVRHADIDEMTATVQE
ncbi:phosphate uptake regulator, PhoU [Spongiibacter sp. IMCC21906]|jgi:phosphate transport system protein|uniref:phosphate signaling complex protein PhoU n=1 Tax=Spongiibacter sp. IMCC21906 TaxID=1620392 RepID=UPI00062E04A0|nr:phosphate signaling complex protein PhoU [Spongiibacter sp. IMCC21906]AKH69897.1 phosphate uptake regulator, PhoU [Spongiibacter sp. IMCC21906]